MNLEPKTFETKKVRIQAVQFTEKNGLDIERWIHDNGESASYIIGFVPYMEIHTEEGRMTAQIGDWIILGTIGEFYPCKDQVFKQKYQEVTE